MKLLISKWGTERAKNCFKPSFKPSTIVGGVAQSGNTWKLNFKISRALQAAALPSCNRIVVSTSRCGRDNPGSNPGYSKFFILKVQKKNWKFLFLSPKGDYVTIFEELYSSLRANCVQGFRCDNIKNFLARKLSNHLRCTIWTNSCNPRVN